MKQFITIILLLCVVFSQTGDTQSFKLKDGTVINGTMIKENNDTLTIQTQYGLVTINRSEIIQTQYEVKLQSGETLIGTKAGENEQSITLITSMGTLTIQRSDIVNIQEVGKQSSTGVTSSQEYYRRPYGITDFLFSGRRIDKDTDFALGEEQLIDLFFDPTGYTLARSTLYLSGLSFGFGVTERFQITTKWSGYFYGNLNLRPKIQLFEIGNWANQHSFSVGAHYHTRWRPNKFEWKSGNVNTVDFTGEFNNYGDTNCPSSEDYCWKQTAKADTVIKYWGGYYRIGENPSYSDPTDNTPTGYDPNAIDAYYDHEPSVNYNDDEESEGFIEMIELFGAYTYSKARTGLRGRISHTLGGNMQYFSLDDEPTVLYRTYYGLDVDINSKLKMIGELFYDPYFLELWQQFEYESYYWSSEDFSDTPVNKPDNYRPIHLDFGFIYALNESFRFGIHFQRPFIAFYWKF